MTSPAAKLALAMPLPEKGYRVRQRARTWPWRRGSHSGLHPSRAPRAGQRLRGVPGARRSGSRASWSAPSRGSGGVPGRRGTCTPRRERRLAGFRRATAAPRAGRLAAPSSGRGAGLGRRPRRRGLRRQLPGDAERERLAAARAGRGRSRLARGNAPPGGGGTRASPSARLRGEGRAADVDGGWRPGGGPSRRAGAGLGGGRARAATPARARRSLARSQAGYWGEVSRLTPPPRKAAGFETPLSARPVGRWWACASSEVLVRECVCGRHCQG